MTKKQDIVAVCDRTLFVLNEKGSIRYQKRLEYTPSCIKTYHLPGLNKDFVQFGDRNLTQALSQASNSDANTPLFSYILGSFSNYLMIYKDIQLVWTTKTTSPPIFIETSAFDKQDGLIVTLSDSGQLQVSYLGMEPPISSHNLDLNQGKDINYEQMDQEHQRLLARIRNHEDEKQVEPSDKLNVNAVLNQMIEKTSEYVDDPEGVYARNESGQVIRLKLKISLSYFAGQYPYGGCFSNVTLNIQAPAGVLADRTVIKIDSLDFSGRSKTPPFFNVYLYPLRTGHPTSKKVSVMASFQ